ncbi:unnamed protein product [Cunninghamella blakesleeana]
MIIKNTELTESSKKDEHQQKRRSQRIFGVLLGTLNKFKNDTLQEKDSIRKREAINNKLQERLSEEKKTIRESLLKEQESKAKLRAEQDKKRAQKKTYDSLVHKQLIAEFLITETKQHLKYLPKKLLPEQQEKIDQQIKKANRDLELYKEQQQKEMDDDNEQQGKENDENKDKHEKDSNNINESKKEDDSNDQSGIEQNNDHTSNDNQEEDNDQVVEAQHEDDEAIDYEG